MGRSLVQIYALAVCFGALMCLVVALGLGLYDVVRVSAPGFTLQEYLLYQTDEQFLMYFPDKKELPEGERAALREKYQLTALDGERRRALQGLTFLAIIIGIDIVVYAIHWRVAMRAGARAASAVQHLSSM